MADLIIMELVPMTSEDEHFVAKATVLIENVDLHIEEEEQVLEAREGLSRTQLREIGAELAEAKERAPRRPEQSTRSSRERMPTLTTRAVTAVQRLEQNRRSAACAPSPGPSPPRSTGGRAGTCCTPA